MPILAVPVLVIVGCAALTGFGFGAYGVSKMQEADQVRLAAYDRYRAAVSGFRDASRVTEARLVELGRLKMATQANEVKSFVALYKPLGGPQAGLPMAGVREVLPSSTLPALDLAQQEALSDRAMEALVAAAEGYRVGTMLTAGAGGLAAAVGTASTGTAIGTLSGAAATKATLAWLGGGAVAAGGGGLALGAVVAGGVTLAPIMAFTGWSVKGQGERAFADAQAYEGKCAEAVQRVNDAAASLVAVDRRVQETEQAISLLRVKVRPHLAALALLKGRRLEELPREDQRMVIDALILSQALAALIDVPLVDENGKPTAQATAFLREALLAAQAV